MKKRAVLKNAVTFFLFGVPMILCMFFPTMEDNGLLFDLRLVPLILGCFYGNSITSLMLFSSLIGIRFLVGGTGAYINVMTAGMTFILILLIFKKFQSFRLIHKILISSLISLVGKTVGLSGSLMYDPNLNYDFSSWILLYILQSVFIGLTVYIIEAITKNVEMRNELIDSEKMKVASVISASVAHEIRNPLTAVRGFIQLLSTSNLAPEKKQLYSQVCIEELDRAQQIINDYLSLARPHLQSVERLDIDEEIQYINNVLLSYAHLKGVEVELQSEPNLFIIGDRQRLRQSIINIAKNGIEAMGEQGGFLKISVSKQKNNVILHISDTGMGMTDEQIRRLGTPYFSNKEKGTGLGTMVAFNIIKNMMGKVVIRSELGRGTEFKLIFPKA
ncbi:MULTISPECIES: sensor histidine kinase [unclassified Paenibacillus]|nr:MULTISPECIES: HAMP domain-containing sensor histidine kinase [unclassified Paenibacillus]